MNARINRGRFLGFSLALVLGLSVAGGARGQLGSAADPPEALMKKMMEAVKKTAYDDFMIECDDTMRGALTKQQFEGVSAMMAPSLQPGYKTTYLGKLRRKAATTYLWKLDPGSNRDETLINVTIKDRKVAGFFLQ